MCVAMSSMGHQSQSSINHCVRPPKPVNIVLCWATEARQDKLLCWSIEVRQTIVLYAASKPTKKACCMIRTLVWRLT